MNNLIRKIVRWTRGWGTTIGVSHAAFFDYDSIFKGRMRWTDTANDARYEGERSAT